MSTTAFDCSICFKLAQNLQSCHQCGLMYCHQCLLNFFRPQPSECIQCGSKKIGPPEESLSEVYQQVLQDSKVELPKLDMKVKQAKKAIVIIEQQCANFELCQSGVAQQFQKEQVCGFECLLYLMIEPLAKKKDYASIRGVVLESERWVSNRLAGNNQQPLIYGVTQFIFDAAGQGIHIEPNKVHLRQDDYSFRTVISTKGFIGGIHYWEILPLPMTQNEMKIGISLKNTFDYNTAFSDHAFGYAYYTIGQFRNGSSSNGKEYGLKIKNSGEIGVLLDMDRGILAFSYNGAYLGKAMQNDILKNGPIFPAIAMMHNAGFEYKIGISIPKNVLKEFLQQ